MKPLVSKKLRDAPKNQACVVCGWDAEGEVVLAHLPMDEYGGTGIKAPDFMGAHLCGKCHTYADGEGRKDWHWRMKAMVRTLERLFAGGKLRVT